MHKVLPVVVLVAVTALVGCSRSAPRGPAWPEPSTTAEDGGESIEPHPSATYAAAIEQSAEPEPSEDKPAETSAAAAAAASTDESKAEAAATGSESAGDDVLMTEEIIIEIEE